MVKDVLGNDVKAGYYIAYGVKSGYGESFRLGQIRKITQKKGWGDLISTTITLDVMVPDWRDPKKLVHKTSTITYRDGRRLFTLDAGAVSALKLQGLLHNGY